LGWKRHAEERGLDDFAVQCCILLGEGLEEMDHEAVSLRKEAPLETVEAMVVFIGNEEPSRPVVPIDQIRRFLQNLLIDLSEEAARTPGTAGASDRGDTGTIKMAADLSA